MAWALGVLIQGRSLALRCLSNAFRKLFATLRVGRESIRHVQVAIQKELVEQWSKFASAEDGAAEAAVSVMPVRTVLIKFHCLSLCAFTAFPVPIAVRCQQVVNVLGKFAPLLRTYIPFVSEYSRMRVQIFRCLSLCLHCLSLPFIVCIFAAFHRCRSPN